MLSSVNNLKINQKLTVTFGAIVAAIVVMCVLVFFGLTGMENGRRELMTAREAQLQAQAAELHMARQDAALRAYIMSRVPSDIDDVSVHRAAFNDSLDRIVALDPTVKTEVEFARAGVEKWFEAVAVHGVGLTNMADYDGVALLDPVVKTLDDLVAHQAERAAAINAEQQKTANILRILMSAGAALALLMAVLSGWWLTSAMATPLRQVTAAMRKLIAGDTQVEIAGAERRDEIGMLASAVNHFKKATQDKAALEARAAAQQKQAEQERRLADAKRDEDLRQDMIAIGALADGLEHLARGDLTWRFNAEVQPKAQGLKDNFNIAMEKLETAVSRVNANVGLINSGIIEISSASDDLSARTEQQAASLEETAAALDQITATVTRTAEGARQATNLVMNARGEAQRSGAVVTNAVNAMNAIEASSNKISAIIGVIDEIAFQTNLLALNAGVEAARAGDAGRGFAVVASEVRALAQRSADAAKEIKVLIQASSQQVGQGVNLVGQTGEALQQIVQRVADIDSLVTEIAASAQEQATGLAQVNAAVNQMDQVTQQNAAMVEETTAAAHSLSTEADTLAASMGLFRVSTPTPMVAAKPMASADAMRAPVSAPVAAPAMAPAPVAASKPAPVIEKAAAPAAPVATRPAPAPMAPKPQPQPQPAAPVAQAAPMAPPAKPLRPANEDTAERPRSVAETMAALKTATRGNTALKAQPVEDGWEEF